MKAAAFKFQISAAGSPQRLFALAVDAMRGWEYWRAAEKDERNGFPFTAAVEWQRAAECFGWISLISDRCWREWERIVHLPRRLAGPIIESSQVVPQCAIAVPEGGTIANAAECLVHAGVAA